MNQTVKWKYLPHFLLVILTAAVYSSSMKFPLLEGWDDHIYVSGNVEKLQFSITNLIYWLTHSCEGCYLPLTMYSYMIDYAVWGLNGLGYHIQNVFWHILAVLAVFSMMRYFKIDVKLAFALALIFSIHPQRVESVVWISERKDVMCAAFYLWSVFFWLGGRNKIISFALFIAAMLSKSMAISLPFVLLACEYFENGGFNPRAWLKKIWPFLLVFVVFIPITILSQDINREGISIPRQTYVLIHNMVWYVRTTFFSSELSPIYPRVLLSATEITRMLAWYMVFFFLGYVFFKVDGDFFKSKILPVLFCFVISIAPVAGFLPLGAIDYADRYSYIPSAFIWIAFGLILAKNYNGSSMEDKSRKQTLKFKAFAVSGCFYIICLAAINLLYSNAWKDYYSLLRYACAYEPPSYIALGALGDMELSRRNYEDAIKVSDRIINREKGLETKKGYDKIILKAKYTKAVALYGLGDKKAAIAIFEEIKPSMGSEYFGSPEGYKNMIKVMVSCYNSIGNVEKAGELIKEIEHSTSNIEH